MNYIDTGERKMKRVVVALLSLGLILAPALSWIHVHIHNLSEPTTMLLLGFGLLGLAGVGRKQLKEFNTHEEENIIIKQRQEALNV